MLPGQKGTLQKSRSSADPTHGRPLMDGDGFEQVRKRLRCPPPQVREHGPQAPQPAQFP